MERVFLGVGSNVDDPPAQLARAWRRIATIADTKLTAVSPVYETAPVGVTDQPSFLNAAAEIATALEPQALLAALQRIEAEAGRPDEPQRQKWGPRPLDLDILAFGDRSIAEPGLSVPHPELAERWFVLKPLADIAPDLVPAGSARPVRELLEAMEAAA